MMLHSLRSGVLQLLRHAARPAAVMIVALAFTPTAFAQGTSRSQSRGATVRQDKAEIVQLEKSWLHALQTDDVATLNRILAPDFVRPAPASGTFITKAEMLSYFRARSGPRATGARFSQLNVWIQGSIAIARGILTTGKPQGNALRRTLFTDVFLRRHGRWQAISAQENNVPGTLAGAKANH